MTTDPEALRLRDQLRAIERQFPGVEHDVMRMSPDDMVQRIAEQEAAVFLPAVAFGYQPAGEFPERLPTIEVECDWLEELIARGNVTCGRFGIGNKIGADPEHLVDAPDWFAFFALSVCPLYIWLTGAPDEWRQQALRRFAVVFPDRGGGARQRILSGPMQTYDEGPRWFGTHNQQRDGEPVEAQLKTGRNDPCHCGSGLKFKRCHGA